MASKAQVLAKRAKAAPTISVLMQYRRFAF
jgi:hypothetical protein